MEKIAKNTIEQLFQTFLKNKDEESFYALFNESFAPLCAYTYKYIEDKDVCEDLIQEVFFHLWLKRDELLIQVSGVNYLLISARNASVDYLRKTKKEKQWDDCFENIQFNNGTVELCSYHELLDALNAALDKLPPHIATVFRLNRFSGKTYVEIAEMQQKSVKTIESYMSKALALLKEELRDYLPFFFFFLFC